MSDYIQEFTCGNITNIVRNNKQQNILWIVNYKTFQFILTRRAFSMFKFKNKKIHDHYIFDPMGYIMMFQKGHSFLI